jgi:hypothetical protein
MVEANEGCDINWGRCAKRVKSTKFVKQILSSYTRIVVILGFAKQLPDFSQKGFNSEEFPLIRQPQNFACKTARWGRVMFFPQEKRLYCLNYTQNFVHKFITYYN